MGKPSKNRRLSIIRTTDHRLIQHNHGKTRVRVLKVDRTNDNDGVHHVYEYSVTTVLHSPLEGVFTKENNTGLIATDTQKNIVYIVAKNTKADSPERFGIDLCQHFMNNYPILTAVEAEVIQTKWKRITIDSQPHQHGFEKSTPETNVADVRIDRISTTDGKQLSPPRITSTIKNMTILKTTQSGFENYHIDKHTLLKETKERCLATELECSWTYDTTTTLNNNNVNYNTLRDTARDQILRGFYGPDVATGVYSVSLQATIYDIACLILDACPPVATVRIFTPNLHYLPMMALGMLGETFEDDIFVPTNEPSGIISCEVERGMEGMNRRMMTARL